MCLFLRTEEKVHVIEMEVEQSEKSARLANAMIIIVDPFTKRHTHTTRTHTLPERERERERKLNNITGRPPVSERCPNMENKSQAELGSN